MIIHYYFVQRPSVCVWLGCGLQDTYFTSTTFKNVKVPKIYLQLKPFFGVFEVRFQNHKS